MNLDATTFQSLRTWEIYSSYSKQWIWQSRLLTLLQPELELGPGIGAIGADGMSGVRTAGRRRVAIEWLLRARRWPLGWSTASQPRMAETASSRWKEHWRRLPSSWCSTSCCSPAASVRSPWFLALLIGARAANQSARDRDLGSRPRAAGGTHAEAPSAFERQRVAAKGEGNEGDGRRGYRL